MDAKPYKIPHPFRKLNKKLIDKIVKDIQTGSTQCYAAEANGITERIFLIWKKQGVIDIEFENDTLPAYLVRSLAGIKQAEVKMCRTLILRSDKGHKGAEWTLEHAYFRHFGSNAALVQLAQDMEEFKSDLIKGKNDGQAKDEDKE